MFCQIKFWAVEQFCLELFHKPGVETCWLSAMLSFPSSKNKSFHLSGRMYVSHTLTDCQIFWNILCWALYLNLVHEKPAIYQTHIHSLSVRKMHLTIWLLSDVPTLIPLAVHSTHTGGWLSHLPSRILSCQYHLEGQQQGCAEEAREENEIIKQ